MVYLKTSSEKKMAPADHSRVARHPTACLFRYVEALSSIFAVESCSKLMLDCVELSQNSPTHPAYFAAISHPHPTLNQ